MLRNGEQISQVDDRRLTRARRRMARLAVDYHGFLDAFGPSALIEYIVEGQFQSLPDYEVKAACSCARTLIKTGRQQRWFENAAYHAAKCEGERARSKERAVK